jgi:HEAT repeat protein
VCDSRVGGAVRCCCLGGAEAAVCDSLGGVVCESGAVIDKGEALRLLRLHAERFDAAGSVTVERIADAVTASTDTGLAATLRDLLARFLEERDHDGRDLSALLLADVAGSAALPDIVTACERDPYDSCYELSELIDSMVRLDGDAAHAELIGMIAGGAPDRCRAALRWLEPVARAEDVPLLAGTAAHPDPAVRVLVAENLPDPADDDAAFAVLAALLHDADERVRGRAGEALGRIGGDPAVGALLAESAGDDPRQRVRAAKALAQVVDGDPRVEPRLRALAADTDAGVRAAVLSGLATAGDVTGRWSSLVGDLAADPDVTVRHRVAGTVAHLHPYPRKVLALLSSDPSGFVREAAVEARRRLPD